MIKNQSISIVIPVFNIGISISKLISKIPVFVDIIYLVDDLCPLKTGKKLGSKTENGKLMFIYQAAVAFNLWHGVKPDINSKTLELLNL